MAGDFICRTVAKVLCDEVMIDGAMQGINTTGGGGGGACAHIVSKRNEDEKLLIAASNGTTTRLAQGAFPGDDADDLRWLASFGAEYGAIAEATDCEIDDLPELVGMMKANRRSAPFAGGSAVGGGGTSRSRSVPRLPISRTCARSGTSPPRAAMRRVLGGSITAFPGDFPDVRGFVEAGDIGIVAVLSSERPEQCDQDPTALAQGYDVTGPNWRGLYVPKGLSDDACDMWNQPTQQMVASEEFQRIRAEQGIDPLDLPGAAAGESVKEDVAEIRVLSKGIGLIQQAARRPGRDSRSLPSHERTPHERPHHGRDRAGPRSLLYLGGHDHSRELHGRCRRPRDLPHHHRRDHRELLGLVHPAARPRARQAVSQPAGRDRFRGGGLPALSDPAGQAGLPDLHRARLGPHERAAWRHAGRRRGDRARSLGRHPGCLQTRARPLAGRRSTRDLRPAHGVLRFTRHHGLRLQHQHRQLGSAPRAGRSRAASGAAFGTPSARPLLVLGDEIPSDLISRADWIDSTSAAGTWPIERGGDPTNLNVCASYRSHWEGMLRGRFTNRSANSHLNPDLPLAHLRAGGSEELKLHEAAVRFEA
ncbi:MAG: Bug family tripartite tricarboxylate transporter substrate binding protein [Salipiger thiooxidans]|uniref:Bug family tripartite tricarboxylate transporter substrate binding protein n=1 Tax=Salipiger thiooxidans TaxID=282683 RepID=UPI001CFAAA8F|nr:hypothetical protein [Salipiger thiooxidans]